MKDGFVRNNQQTGEKLKPNSPAVLKNITEEALGYLLLLEQGLLH
jgi:hypothetical protein